MKLFLSIIVYFKILKFSRDSQYNTTFNYEGLFISIRKNYKFHKEVLFCINSRNSHNLHWRTFNFWNVFKALNFVCF